MGIFNLFGNSSNETSSEENNEDNTVVREAKTGSQTIEGKRYAIISLYNKKGQEVDRVLRPID
jgi:hypothetical protein